MGNAMLARKGSVTVQIECPENQVSFDELSLLESHLGDILVDLMRLEEMQED